MKNKIKTLTLLIVISATNYLFGQEKFPTLKSNTESISIREKNILYKDIWTASSETKLDVFVPNSFIKEDKITFYSDIDSISFKIKPQKKYNFVILLHGKEKAYTQINTFKNQVPSLDLKLTYKRNNGLNSKINDTIPFEIGKDNGIHIKGRINDSEKLDFLFDTGAGINVVTKSLIGTKIKVVVDGNTQNKGSDGISIVNTSSKNKIQIGDLIWDNVNLLSVDYKNFPFDIVLSWKVFETKLVEIDYENRRLVIHDRIGEISNDYTKSEMKMINGIPFIKCNLIVNGKESESWFDFDSGYNGNLILSQKFASSNLLNNLKSLGSAKSKGSTGIEFKQNKVLLPRLKIGNYEIYNLPVIVNETDPVGADSNEIIGNNILKRFNAILDFQNNIIYLKPNKLFYTTLE